MKEIIDKISSYDLFNNLLPGVIFVLFLREITDYNLIQENLLIGVGLYYFIGLVISRFGSLVIEETLKHKKIKFLKKADYKDYILACDIDYKIDLFSEVNNMYRNLLSAFCLLVLSKIHQLVSTYFEIPNDISLVILLASLIILFAFSYRKQTQVIVERVKIRNKKEK